MRVRSVLFLVALLPAPLLAQADTARGGIEGTVYDSIARRVIAGATVQLVNAALPSGSVVSARSDARGRYAFRGVYPGRYLVGFQHEALDTMALESPMLAVDVRPGHVVSVDLAIPSPAHIVETACQVAAADSTGLLIGVVRDAGTALHRARGRIQARWTDLVIDTSGITSQQRERAGDISGDGWFAICLPAGEGIAIRATSDSDSSGVRLVDIPPNAVVRHDIALGGSARIRGRVRGDGERPLARAHVGFAGTDRRTTADSGGAFVLDGPAGSQTFEVRALGYVADRHPITLRAGIDTVIDVSLVSVKRVLDTVQITASRVFSRDSDGFQQRSRSGNGRFWDVEDFQRSRFHDIYDALRQAPSISVIDNGVHRAMTMRGGLEGRCVPAVYLNGVQLHPEFLADLDLMVRPDEVSGMELYSVAQAPAQFQSLNGCGSLVIWTRPRARPRR